jgi:hypothetical protein
MSALAVLLAPSVRSEFIETFRNMKNSIRGLLSFKMLVDFSAFVFSGYALSNGITSLVGALETAVAPLFTFVIALFITLYFPRMLEEKIDKRAILTKLLAIVLVATGIIFINL